MMRSKGAMAEKANDMLLSNDGSLFKKLADKNGRLDQAGLEKALKYDQTPGGTRLFTDAQRETVKWMIDNYKTPAISQLRDQGVQKYPMTMDSIRQAVLDTNVAQFPAMNADKAPLIVPIADAAKSLATVDIPDIKPAPAPKVEEPAPAPKVEAPAPAPKVEEPAPAPKVEAPAPAPKVEEPAPVPKVEAPAPAQK